jgi:hypothetical protein
MMLKEPEASEYSPIVGGATMTDPYKTLGPFPRSQHRIVRFCLSLVLVGALIIIVSQAFG